jgi:hypothetical protein
VLNAVDTRTAPTYDTSTLNNNGEAVFTLLNVAELDFVIEATPSLEGTILWAPVLTNLNSGAVFQFIDADQDNFQKRFFRTLLLP